MAHPSADATPPLPFSLPTLVPSRAEHVSVQRLRQPTTAAQDIDISLVARTSSSPLETASLNEQAIPRVSPPSAVTDNHTESFRVELPAHIPSTCNTVEPSPCAPAPEPRDLEGYDSVSAPNYHLLPSPCPPTSTPPPLPPSPPATQFPLSQDRDVIRQQSVGRFLYPSSPVPPNVTPPPSPPVANPYISSSIRQQSNGEIINLSSPMLPSATPVPLPPSPPVVNPSNVPLTRPYIACSPNQTTLHHLPEHTDMQTSHLLTRDDAIGSLQRTGSASIEPAVLLSPLHLSTNLALGPRPSTPSDLSCSFSKLERLFPNGKPGGTIWYECKSMGSCDKTSQQHFRLLRQCGEQGHMFLHRRWEGDDGEFWLMDGYWKLAIEGCQHPCIRGRRLHIRASGEPSWLTSGSYSVHKSRIARRIGGGTRSVSVVRIFLSI